MKKTPISFPKLFLITVSLLSIVFTVAVTWTVSRQFQASTIKYFIHYTETVAHDLSLMAGEFILTENFGSMQDYVTVYQDKLHIESIAILDLNGKILAASNPDIWGQTIHLKNTSDVNTLNSNLDLDLENWTMEYQYPINFSGVVIGWCLIDVNLKLLKDNLRTLHINAVSLGLFLWLLAIISSLLAASFINRSLRSLMVVAHNISQGSFDKKAELRGPREIYQLAEAFNTMRDGIKKREEDLRNSENRFRSLVEEINDLVWEVDKTGTLTYVSPAVKKILGYTPEELIGKTPFDVIAEDERDRIKKLLIRKFKDKSGFTNLPITHIHKNSQKIILNVTGQPIIDKNGFLIGFRGVDWDITEQYNIQKALEAEKERLTVTLQSIGDGVITTDTNGNIVLLNKIAEILCGWNNYEAVGKHVSEVFYIINKETGQKCVSPVEHVLKHGKIIGLTKYTSLVAKDGTTRSIADSGAPIRNKKGETIGVVLVFRDISKEKKIEEELLKMKKLESIGVLAGGIAHDFNNILSAILGNIEMAAKRIPSEDTQTSSLLIDAQKASKRATKLTHQLLTFSKGGEPIKDKTSLPQLVRDSADFVLHGSNVRCSYDFPDSLWLVDIDSGQIGQVIQNIIINSQHAMSLGGTISIKCYNINDNSVELPLRVNKGNYVSIQVKDTGKGISKGHLEKVFDPYFTTKQGGSGLGLAICYSIVTKHGGYLAVDSTPEQGTTFTIFLPAMPAAEINNASDTKSFHSFQSSTIMVMDDDEMVRDVAKAQLIALGHKPILVKDGEEAIAKYQELKDNNTPVELVIMDLTIPGGMGGKEAAEKLLLRDPDARLIVSSGYSNDPVMANYGTYGFTAAVAKPFDLDALNTVIGKCLSKVS